MNPIEADDAYLIAAVVLTSTGHFMGAALMFLCVVACMIDRRRKSK